MDTFTVTKLFIAAIAAVVAIASATRWDKSARVKYPTPPVSGGTISASYFEELYAALEKSAKYNKQGALLAAASAFIITMISLIEILIVGT